MRWIYRVTRKDKKGNVFLCEQSNIVSIDDKMRKKCLRCLYIYSVLIRYDIITTSDTKRGKECHEKISLET